MKKSHKKLEIVLLKDVEKLGEKRDLVKVAKGYAINFLMPQGLAVLKTDNRAAKLLREAGERRQKQEKDIEKARAMAEKLVGLKVEIKAKTGEKGKLFGSVKKSDIIKEIEDSAKKKLGEVEIEGDLPIKKVGDYVVKLKLTPGVEVEVKVVIAGDIKVKKSKKTK